MTPAVQRRCLEKSGGRQGRCEAVLQRRRELILTRWWGELVNWGGDGVSKRLVAAKETYMLISRGAGHFVPLDRSAY